MSVNSTITKEKKGSVKTRQHPQALLLYKSCQKVSQVDNPPFKSHGNSEYCIHFYFFFTYFEKQISRGRTACVVSSHDAKVPPTHGMIGHVLDSIYFVLSMQCCWSYARRWGICVMPRVSWSAFTAASSLQPDHELACEALWRAANENHQKGTQWNLKTGGHSAAYRRV